MKATVEYAAIHRYADKYGVKGMCEFFKVSRSGYYVFCKKQGERPGEQALAQMIRECQHGSRGTYGYRRVQIWLKRNGIHANQAVLRIMNKYGLLSQIRRRRKYRQMGEQLHRFISYVPTPQGTLYYLSVIRDLFGNSIIAYQMGTEQSINLVLRTIQQARKNEAVTAEVQLHSDQGFQYTSQAYFSLTQKYGITPSMSRRGNCYDNAMAENFFSILKTECLRRQKPKTTEQARLLIRDYIHFYNHERIQTKTKLTPLEKRRQFT